MNKEHNDRWHFKQIASAFVISVGTGAILYGVLLYAGWVNLRDENPFKWYRYNSLKNAHAQISHDAAIMEKLKSGEYPSLGSYETLADDLEVSPPFFEKERFRYSWSESEGLAIFDPGRDGKPGGTGYNADLYHDQRNHEATLPSFWEFYTEGGWPDSIVGSGGFFTCVVTIFLFFYIQFT